MNEPKPAIPPDPARPKSPWVRATMAAVLVLVAKFHLTAILDPWRFGNGDVRQHVFWTASLKDPGLFPDDLLVQFISSPRFDPPGYVGLYAAGVQLLEPLLFSKWVAIGLSVLVAWLSFRIGSSLGGPRLGFLATVALAFMVFDDLRGGLPRSFGFPLVLAFVDAVLRRSQWQAGLTILASSAFYPPVVPSMAILAPLFVLRGCRIDLRGLRSSILRIGLPAGFAFVLLQSSYLVRDRELVGEFVTKEEAYAMPEFHQGGRNEFWVSDKVAFYLGDWSYNRSASGLLSGMVFWPLCAALVMMIAMRLARRRIILPPVLGWMAVSSSVLFVLAHLVLFKLFLPSRYTQFTWPVAFALIALVNAGPWLGPLAERIREKALWGLRGWLLFLVLAATVVLASATSKSHAPTATMQAFYRTVSALPKAAVIAGWPSDLDNIPIRCQRSVLVNRELALPYYKAYYARVRERIMDSMRMVLARERQDVVLIARKHNVSHLLVNKEVLALVSTGPADPALLAQAIDPPYDRLLKELVERAGEPIFSREHGFRVLHEDEIQLLVELEN